MYLNRATSRVARVMVVFVCLLFLLAFSSLFSGEPLQLPVLETTESPKNPDDLAALLPRIYNETTRVAKVTVALNTLNSTIIAGALKSHHVQNQLYGYQHFVGTDILVHEDPDPQGRPLGTWTKPAYILSLLLAEMEKPEDERLEWLFWFDADTVILNPYIRLETFLPPNRPLLDDIHLLLTENWDGINAGVFPIRVNKWSVLLLSAYVAYPSLNPGEILEFRDQTALAHLISEYPAFQDNYSIVPHRWFNALPINSAFDENGTWIYATRMTPDEFDSGEPEQNGEVTQPWKVLKGDMAVHFAGAKERQSWMQPWIERTEMYLPEWSSSVYQEIREKEANAFWFAEMLKMQKARDAAAKMTADQWKEKMEDIEKEEEREREEKRIKAAERMRQDEEDHQKWLEAEAQRKKEKEEERKREDEEADRRQKQREKAIRKGLLLKQNRAQRD